MSATALSQRSRVMRLYRHTLKNSLSWVFSRDVWMVEVHSITTLRPQNNCIRVIRSQLKSATYPKAGVWTSLILLLAECTPASAAVSFPSPSCLSQALPTFLLLSRCNNDRPRTRHCTGLCASRRLTLPSSFLLILIASPRTAQG